jgi:hypothetical protein
MRTVTLSVCAMLIAGACLAGEHEDAARLLVQTTGEAERAAQSLKQHLLESFDAKPDGILKQAVVDAVSTLEAVDVEDLLHLVYAKHFTTEELAEMTVFARTPLGRKLFRKQPILFRDGKRAIIYLAKQISQRAAKQAVEEHGEDAMRQEMQKPGSSNKTGGR